MQEPDLKAIAEHWYENLEEQIYIDLENMKREAWFGSDSTKGSNPIEAVAIKIIDTYESEQSIKCLYADGFTPQSASAKIIEYYQEWWEDEKMVGEDYL